MSLVAAPEAIRRYFAAHWTYDVPLGQDGHPFTAIHRSVRLTILMGKRPQLTIGRVQNVVGQIGTLTGQVYTDGGKGASASRVIGKWLIDLTHNITLDATGAVVTTASQTALVRFSPPEMGDNPHPYVSSDEDGVPFRQTNIVCPFIAYELR